MSEEKITEIINKVKNDYSDIGWIPIERDFHPRSGNERRYLIDNEKKKLTESYSRGKKYMISRIKEIEDYIVITELTSEPGGNIEFTKGSIEDKSKKDKENQSETYEDQFNTYIEDKKSSFEIEQDFFICYFFRVINDNDSEYLVELNEFLNRLNNNLPINTILYGPPGTGKTYNSVKYAVETIKIIFNLDNSKKYSDYINKFNELKAAGQIAFTTFHQSYGYEEFIEGIKPVLGDSNEKNELDYKISDGVFKEFCKRAASDKSKKYVFIIDEINRGNISKIFGELITLIEDSKRNGKKEAMSVTLPYSQEEFSVPKNVYILGTMNTADRSIALMDTALRRRFEFIEMMPDISLLKDVVVKDNKDNENAKDNKNNKEIDIQKMLEKMNQRIEVLYDREHTLGHAFFMPLKNEKKATIDQLASIFKNKILPLLQEYFYEDYEKIMLVLGIDTQNKETKKFISVKSNGNLFKNSPDIDLNPTYQINEEAFQTPDNYMTIYGGASNEEAADETKDSDS